MAAEKFKARDLQVSEFTLDNIGVWPALYRGLVCLAVFLVVLVAGYFLHAKDLYITLESAERKEASLRESYREKAFEVANLEAYKQQMIELEASFNALLGQLPAIPRCLACLRILLIWVMAAAWRSIPFPCSPKRLRNFMLSCRLKLSLPADTMMWRPLSAVSPVCRGS